MIEITLLDFILSWVVLLIAFLALRRYTIPPWVLFIVNAAFVVYWIVVILQEGPRVMAVILLIAGAAVATHIWWRDLRGREWNNRSQPGERR